MKPDPRRRVVRAAAARVCQPLLQGDAEVADGGVRFGGALVADQDLAQRSGQLAPLAAHPGLERVDRGGQRGPAHVLHGHPDVGLGVGGLLADLDAFRRLIRVAGDRAAQLQRAVAVVADLAVEDQVRAPGDAFQAGSGGPQPGEGPSKHERETGFYDVLFVGLAADGRQVRVAVRGDRDPGYGSTSKMIAECAICLVRDMADLAGGIWTPGAAMGDRLIKRLVDNAGLTFAVEA